MAALQIRFPAPGLASFPIPLPDNPLKWLNCYVILGGAEGRSLLIDSGFRLKACRDALFAGMDALGLRPENTDVFFTHAHADHTGNARALQDRGYRLLMGRIDLETLNTLDWEARKRRALCEGMPKAVLEEVFLHNPAVRLASEPFDAEAVEAGTILTYGTYRFRCLLCPGHTPGHLCLLDEEKELLLTGDHVLFDITPNINSRWPSSDALGDYMESLRALRPLRVSLALPAHRSQGDGNLSSRIDALLAHHERRLEETESILRQMPDSTAYQITSHITWRIRARNWDAFPPGQKWFAMSEALAHLDHLVRTGRCLRMTDEAGFVRYR